ncbi:putative vacuolar protein sorting-associated protein [Helianthus anomalus]
MLEDQVAYLLQRYLGNYVRGLSKEALSISVWQGNVELTNMQLKPEALNALKLPVKVKAGFLGSVKLKVPWSRIGQEPVLVYLDRIYLLAEPETQVEGYSEDVVQKTKKSRIHEMEMKMLESRRILTTEMNTSWLGSFINTIIGNLKLSISSIHIRYEDLESNPGHPFAAGVTLEKLSASTVDDSGKEAFVTGGALEQLQKSVELERLAVYLDSDITPWHITKRWEDLQPSEWDKVFSFGTKDGKPASGLVQKHTYILQPVTGNATYVKQRSNSSNRDQPLQKAAVSLDDVTICLSKSGYRDLLKLADNFSSFNQRLKYAHFRPLVPVRSDPRSWWKYAYRVVSDQMKKASGRTSWEQVLKYATMRKKYISLYASLLKSDPGRETIDGDKDIEELDRELDIELIVQWRMLAHKFLEKSAQSDIYLKKQNTKKSWWSFGWSGESAEDGNQPGHFTDEDWTQLNEIIGYKEGDNNEQLPNKDDRGDVVHTLIEVHMKHNASGLAEGHELVAELSCENLDCLMKFYKDAKVFDMKLGSYRLSSPDGLLAESATSYDSLVGVFRYKPFDAKVDWSMVAKASPCYATYLKNSVDKIVNFFESNAAVSQKIALETAAAVQMTIDEVKRSAQQQVNKALKDHARFFLDLDIAAPKITIPTEFSPDSFHSTKLLLDLGNLIIRTQDDDASKYDKDIYLQFDVVLSDVSAFFVDGDYHWSQHSLKGSVGSSQSSIVSYLPVIDKCGVTLKLQQIRSEDPSFPTTRLAVRLPFLGFHFSPARYHRLMQIAKIFQGEDNDIEDLIRPWDLADFEGWLSVLNWKGVGNREAVWQRRYFCLVGPFLYTLEAPGSRSYKQSFSLLGKQVYAIPPDAIGDVENVLAVCRTDRSTSKIVEDANALILRCESDESRKNWKSLLQGAIYRASGSAPITGLSETSSESEDSEVEEVNKLDLKDISKAEKLFITGVLDELKLCFNYSTQTDKNYIKVLLAEEIRLFELRAIGGRVELSIRANDMFIGTVLKALEVEDLVSCKGVNQPCYLARSFIRHADAPPVFRTIENQSEADDQFYEASDSLNDPGDSPGREFEYSSSVPSARAILKTPSFSRIAGLLPDDARHSGENNLEVTHTLDSFVKAQIVFIDSNSVFYDNIDKRVTVTLATLSFYCRRPIIVAIMEFVGAISAEDDTCESFSDHSPTAIVNGGSREIEVVDQSSVVDEPKVRGLLGKGRSRIVFFLTLNMARAQILLMKEDGTKLATMSQDNFLTDIKVFPSSFSIKASLGNLKMSDDSLPSSHMYFWACDMRNPGGSSFVELVFSSFSADDEDYAGFDYSLIGQLSEVRLVYLNRFIQEIINYFMGLVPTNSVDVVKVKDHVTDSEKWVKTSEIEGSPAVKLDLSLRKPIILMPRRTDSLDYLKLDIVHITVQNTFQWFGGTKKDMNAVHLDVMTIKVEDINLNVGTGTELGESIIHDVKGVSIIISRSLRDLLHQVPSTEVSIKIDVLKAALSNKEYHIISECALSNFSETPNTIPPLNDTVSDSADVVNSLVHQGSEAHEYEAQNEQAWISMKVCVIVGLVEMSLHYGMARDASLATLQVGGLWMLYKANTLGEGLLSATLKGFTVNDDREGTEEELRLAVRQPKNVRYRPDYDIVNDENENIKADVKYDETSGIPTMLILDAKFSQYTTSICLCIQRPQLLVALDFLMAVAEFFVPTVREMLSNEEDDKTSYLVDALDLDNSTFSQSDEIFTLSPQKPLVVECENFDHYTYDGRGGTLLLQDREGKMICSTSVETIIYIGCGKYLQFKNVTIKNGQYLDLCVSLGSSSSYSVSENDNVYLEEMDESPSSNAQEETSKNLPSTGNTATRPTETSVELQVISPELTFYNSSKYIGESPIFSNKFLHARLDAFCRLVLKGDTVEMSANALGLTMESNGIRILEPFDTSVKFSNASGKTNIHVAVSDIFMNFSFSALRLFLAVEEDVLKFLRMTSRKMTVSCSEFDKLGTFQNAHNNQTYAFWRPHAPPGFAVLGDYLTAIDKPPTKGVLAVNTRYVRIKKPEAFKLVWPPSDLQDVSLLEFVPSVDGAESCSIWFPVAPKGYVALGCVVSPGKTQPSLSSAFCLHASLLSPCALRDCITISSGDTKSPNLAFWRVDNSLGTFLPADPGTLNVIGRAYELRHILFGFRGASSRSLKGSNVQAPPSDSDNIQPERSSAANSGRRFQAVASFRLIWWNQGSKSRKKLSIWRPIIPPGMVYFGDIAVSGYEPPNTCIVLPDDDEPFKAPIGFQMVGQIKKHRGAESIAFWLPQAPPGYVCLGCVAFKGTPKQSDFDSLRCMRSDMVTGDDFLDESIWDTSDIRFSRDSFSIWGVGNELGTFMVRSGFKKPPRRFAAKLVDFNTPTSSDDTVVDAEIRTFSAALFDDYGGMMTPLFNVSLSSVGFSLHRRPDYLNSTVSFSLAARSYNDKLEAWEPLVEPVDAVVRYQNDANAPSAASQLRLTSTRDLNLNITVSNANMLIQAYASWNNLSQVHEPSTVRDATSPSGGTPIIDVHHSKNYFVIPQNKLGQDIYVRATEVRGLPHVIKMPSGEKKPLKVPVSKNMLDSHLKGNLFKKVRSMVTIIISQAQFSRVGGLGSHQYGIAVCLTPVQNLGNGLLLGRQSARTCGASSESEESSNLELVTWNEIFFFKADPQDDYMLELVATDMGKGVPVGYFSSSLKELHGTLDESAENGFKWLELSPADSTKTSNVNISKTTRGRIKCAVFLSPRSRALNTGKGLIGERNSGYIQISPSREGPWTTVRLNYVAHAACWPLGNAVVASEVIVEDGNRYVNIRSLVSVSNNTELVLELCLRLNASSNENSDTIDDAKKDSPTDDRKTNDVQEQIFIGELKPGESLPLPLFGLVHSGLYVLQLRPSFLNDHKDYSWSSVVDRHVLSEDVDIPKETSGINVSSLYESEELLYCSETSGTSTSSNRLHGMWFSLAIQASEISKDISSDPIQDWNIVVKSPLSITNYLPLTSEFSVLEMQTNGHFRACARGVFTPGETVNILNADIRNPLYFSLLPQHGWLPIHEAVLISHSSIDPAKTLGLRSSVSGRVVHVVLEQNFEIERPLAPKILRIYTPYWLTVARCPPLAFRLVDISSKKTKSKVSLPFKSKKTNEVILEEITEEEFHDGYTIASALNFKLLGMSASISDNGNDHFGDVKDLSALGDMDGSLGVSAYDASKNCMLLFVSSKPTSYQSVPTKVITVRPYMTFTNRLGQDIYVKLSSEDPPKLLKTSDVRVSFVFHETEEPSKLQIRVEGTEWSFPVHIEREDTIFVVLNKEDGTQSIIRTEIRGYEEGSRFIVVFRRGPKDGPIRIENRTTNKVVRIRQSGFSDDAWVPLQPRSSTKFSWVDPYGEKFIDTEVHSDNQVSVCKLNMEKSGVCLECGEGTRLLFHVVEMGNIKVGRFVDDTSAGSRSDGLSRSLASFENWRSANMAPAEQENAAPLELIVELGVVGVSLVDHRPKELSYLYLERVFVSYSTGYDSGTTSRFKLIVGHLQLDNQLPLTLMPVLLAPEEVSDMNHPVFKMTITISNENADGLQVYPYVYIRVTDKIWRLNIHEPIIWASVEFFSNLRLDRIPQSSSVAQVDPEIRVNLIDVSEVRLKLSLETAPAQRPHGVLGVWSPILSAVGNAFKLNIHLRKVIHKDRYMRKSSVVPAISNRIWRDLIHNPLHLIFSVDVLGMTSSTLASLSKGFAELSTDGQFMQLRSKQVWSRRITGVGDGFLQGTEALAQGVAFGVSGVVRKPVESARQNGLLGLAHGLGRACLGFVVQPVSGALDFFSLTVDGIGASFSRCLEVINNKTIIQRIRNPRAIRADNVLREYSETEAVGQMILYLAEASRRFGCTDIFKEPSKFAWSDLYEDHFIVPYHRIVLVTSKRVMLLQCLAPEKMDKKPCKIMWDVPWEDLMALELAKAGNPKPSHLILHLIKFKKADSFVRVIKCSTEEESEGSEPQAVRICVAVRKMWRAYQSSLKSLILKVPSSQKQVSFAWNEADWRSSRSQNKSIIKSRDFLSPKFTSDKGSFVKHAINFTNVWTSEQESKGRHTLSKKNVVEDGMICSIWRPICPDGYISVGDIARIGTHPPNVAAVYQNTDRLFALPVGYDLVWRNCAEDYASPVSIWRPRAPEGYVSGGCVAMAGFNEPEPDVVYCMAESIAEETTFEEQQIWFAPDSYPWTCCIYQVRSPALHFVALRQPKEEAAWKPMRVVDRSSEASTSSSSVAH